MRSVNNPHSQRTVKSDAIGRDTVLAALSAEASRRDVRTLTIAVVGLANVSVVPTIVYEIIFIYPSQP